jgi:hypothetical protein
MVRFHEPCKGQKPFIVVIGRERLAAFAAASYITMPSDAEWAAGSSRTRLLCPLGPGAGLPGAAARGCCSTTARQRGRLGARASGNRDAGSSPADRVRSRCRTYRRYPGAVQTDAVVQPWQCVWQIRFAHRIAAGGLRIASVSSHLRALSQRNGRFSRVAAFRTILLWYDCVGVNTGRTFAVTPSAIEA